MLIIKKTQENRLIIQSAVSDFVLLRRWSVRGGKNQSAIGEVQVYVYIRYTCTRYKQQATSKEHCLFVWIIERGTLGTSYIEYIILLSFILSLSLVKKDSEKLR